jgi:hypothetical protein
MVLSAKVCCVLASLADATVYCPSGGDLVVAYGDGVQLTDGGWSIQGDGGAATKAAFNLNGGYVEFDFDVSGANTGVIPNIYTVSPDGIGGGFSSDHYCDDGENDKPDCLEVDWIEANGGCGGATTLHTVSGTGPGACNYWGCRSTYSFGGSTFHMKVEYGNDGKFTITRDGQQISGDSLDPAASGNDWGILKSTYESKGGVIYSSQWTGSWVPADFCGGGPGDLGGSHFSVSNLRISGSVVQGPEPQKCSGPQPSPSPSPSPTPSPSGQCSLMPGKNNDGSNLKSSADSTGSAAACCSLCQSTSGCVGFTWVHDNDECWMKSSVDSPRDDGCGGCVTSGTVDGPSPPSPPSPPTPSPEGAVEYCPDPETDFQEEREPGASGQVTWSENGWSITGWLRVSSKASFDFSGGGAEWDMDLSGAQGNVNNNFYVTYPSDHCGLNCYCDSGGSVAGCAEMDWTENNGGCYQATTWHDDASGGDHGGYGGNGGLGGGTVHFSTKYSDDGSSITVTAGGNSYNGNGQTGEMKSKGAVIYSSQWQGWVPGDCGSGDLGSSTYAVKNLKITGKVIAGPEPRRCHPITTAPTTTTTTPAPHSDCPGGSLSVCIANCPSDAAVYKLCVDECVQRCGSAVTFI